MSIEGSPSPKYEERPSHAVEQVLPRVGEVERPSAPAAQQPGVAGGAREKGRDVTCESDMSDLLAACLIIVVMTLENMGMLVLSVPVASSP